jgi:hypothetical protein
LAVALCHFHSQRAQIRMAAALAPGAVRGTNGGGRRASRGFVAGRVRRS